MQYKTDVEALDALSIKYEELNQKFKSNCRQDVAKKDFNFNFQ